MQSEHDDQIQALYAELADATDGLVTAQGYMEMSFTREPLTFLWDYYDHADDEAWVASGGAPDDRPSAPPPPELVERLRAVVAEHAGCLQQDPVSLLWTRSLRRIETACTAV